MSISLLQQNAFSCNFAKCIFCLLQVFHGFPTQKRSLSTNITKQNSSLLGTSKSRLLQKTQTRTYSLSPVNQKKSLYHKFFNSWCRIDPVLQNNSLDNFFNPPILPNNIGFFSYFFILVIDLWPAPVTIARNGIMWPLCKDNGLRPPAPSMLSICQSQYSYIFRLLYSREFPSRRWVMSALYRYEHTVSVQVAFVPLEMNSTEAQALCWSWTRS